MKNLFLITTLFLIFSCGSLKLLPQGCHTEGIWGQKSAVNSSEQLLSFTKEYYVWNVDEEVRLKDFLKEMKVNCDEVKEMHVEIKSIFFVRRELTVYVLK